MLGSMLESSKFDMTFDLAPILNRVDSSFTYSELPLAIVEGDNAVLDPSVPCILPLTDFSSYETRTVAEESDTETAVSILQQYALHQLSLDLSLSRTVFTNQRPIHPFIAPDWHSVDVAVEDGDETLARAAGSLSLTSTPMADANGGAPSPLLPRDRTGFLRPKWAAKDKVPTEKRPTARQRRTSITTTSGKGKGKGKASISEDIQATSESQTGGVKPMGFAKIKLGEAEQPVGVRALLKEWIVGEDPETYDFSRYETRKAGLGGGGGSFLQTMTSQSARPIYAPQSQRWTTTTGSQLLGVLPSHPAPSTSFAQAIIPSTPRAPGIAVASSSSQVLPHRAPPTIKTTSSQVPFHTPRISSSYTQAHSQFDSYSQSQAQDHDAGPSTQVERGRFGGRPSTLGADAVSVPGTIKKSAAKKKRAGF